ncbi:hypothetical protein ACM26V_24620 [Salipaludibacillus sp. HK11]|uniref:hypothetical protein n=1 Tax=Salipaludibacillus sp. HK11 TaxID=3394320 RepID=UPI0039FCD077
MLRKSDFTLTGRIDRLDEFEIRMLVNRIFHHYSTAVRFFIDYKVIGKHVHLAESYDAEFRGMESSLLFLGINVEYRGADILQPYFFADEIITEFERPEEEVEAK